MAEKKPTTTKKPTKSKSSAAKTSSKKSATKKNTSVKTAKAVKSAKPVAAKSATLKTEKQKAPVKKDQPTKKNRFKRSKVTKPITVASLYSWNKWLALVHALQGAVILVLSTTVTFPVVTNFLTIDPLATGQSEVPVLVPATEHIADLNVAYLVAIFFFMSAIAHAVIASVYRKRYEADLVVGVNKARWIEYSLSASTMMVAIGALVGVVSLSAFVMIFALTAVMNLLGLIMEVSNQGKSKISWLSYIVGCIAGIVPWLVIAEYLISGAMYGSTAPTFVYVIFASMFLLFSSFAVNMYLQYAKVGKWKDYMYGERGYMILSLVAKSALAWQIFAGTLRP